MSGSESTALTAGVFVVSEDERALYVDFEGPQDGQPAVLGVLRGTRGTLDFRQVVVDPAFRAAAAGKNLPSSEIRDAIDALALEVSETGSFVFAWSMHEMDVFTEFGSPKAAATLKARYRNVIPIAKRWRSRFAFEWWPPKQRMAHRGRHTLDAYMKKMGYSVPRAFGPLLTGKRLRAVRSMLAERDNEYARLTPTVKGQWTRLLKHNEYDCFGLRFVCLRALGDLGEK